MVQLTSEEIKRKVHEPSMSLYRAGFPAHQREPRVVLGAFNGVGTDAQREQTEPSAALPTRNTGEALEPIAGD
eukprot:1190092-Prorocentrum_minimum.AAC.3